MLIKNEIVLSQCSIVLCLIFFYQVKGEKCNFNVQVEQRLLNEGFHRNLSIMMDFASDIVEERWLYKDCMVGVDQMLPAGVYSTLEDINQYGCKSLKHAAFQKRVDVELPTEKAEPFAIHLLSKVTDYTTHIYIPVHARYHTPRAGGGTARNVIPTPKLYLLCAERRLDACAELDAAPSTDNHFCAHVTAKEACPWKEIPIIMVTAPVTWDVPVGDTAHAHLVAWGTAVVVAAGSLHLLNTMHRYNKNISPK